MKLRFAEMDNNQEYWAIDDITGQTVFTIRRVPNQWYWHAYDINGNFVSKDQYRNDLFPRLESMVSHK